MEGRKLVVPVVIAVLGAAIVAGVVFVGFRPSTIGLDNSPPFASFAITESEVFVGDPITVDASASRDPDGEIVLYEWDWNSDGTFDATGVTATHAYEQAGPETITLRLTDDDGARASSSRQVSVSERSGEVVILSHGMYVDTGGHAHVVGEVQWIGSINVAFVGLTATFRDSSGTVVAVGFAYTAVSILTPNQRSPFEIIERDNVERISRYALSVTHVTPTTATPYRSFSVHDDSMYEDGVGYLHVVGTVTNTGSSTATHVEVIITFRDTAGNAVAMTTTSTSPADLDAGASVSFEAIHPPGSAWNAIVGYDVHVDG